MKRFSLLDNAPNYLVAVLSKRDAPSVYGTQNPVKALDQKCIADDHNA